MAQTFPNSTAAINWSDNTGRLHLRVYSSDGYTVTEYCFDGNGWSPSGFQQPGSQVSATCFPATGGTSIRLYCTFEDTTTEWCSDPTVSEWYQGSFNMGS